jgi:hypothetical protein
MTTLADLSPLFLLIVLFLNSYMWERRVKVLQENIEILAKTLKGLVALPCPLEPGEEKTFSVTISREKAND